MFWRLFFPLRRHLRRVGRARNATRPQLFALNVIFGFRGFGAVWRYLPDHGLSFPGVRAQGCARYCLRNPDRCNRSFIRRSATLRVRPLLYALLRSGREEYDRRFPRVQLSSWRRASCCSLPSARTVQARSKATSMLASVLWSNRSAIVMAVFPRSLAFCAPMVAPCFTSSRACPALRKTIPASPPHF